MKRIGVLTSGGDAPGMNAAIRAVVRTAIPKGIEVVGVLKGYQGLMSNKMHPLKLRSVCDIIQRGGTILYSARSKKFNSPEGVQKAVEVCHKNNLDGLIVIGGDGSFRGARDLTLAGIPCVAIPATIDNDIVSTEYAIGFDTAVNTVMEMVDRLRDTCESHARCFVVEVMGKDAGYIALEAGISCGAVSIIVPEFPFDMERDIVARMNNTLKTGKENFIIIVAEGVGKSQEIADFISKTTKIETRLTVLGHVQRGGIPTPTERVMASVMGHYAVELLAKGISNRVVAIKNGKPTDYDIVDALAMKKELDRYLLQVAKEISI